MEFSRRNNNNTSVMYGNKITATGNASYPFLRLLSQNHNVKSTNIGSDTKALTRQIKTLLIDLISTLLTTF